MKRFKEILESEKDPDEWKKWQMGDEVRIVKIPSKLGYTDTAKSIIGQIANIKSIDYDGRVNFNFPIRVIAKKPSSFLYWSRHEDLENITHKRRKIREILK